MQHKNINQIFQHVDSIMFKVSKKAMQVLGIKQHTVTSKAIDVNNDK